MIKSKDISVMIFAAGFGTRMGELTKDCPKPLLPLQGRTLIDQALDHVWDFEPNTVLVNAHYHAEKVLDHFANSPVTVLHEQPKVLETGGGLKAALPHIPTETVITMNSDTLWLGPNPLSVLVNAWDPEAMDALLLCVPAERAIGHTGSGDFAADPKGRITRRGPLTYAGIQIIKTHPVHNINETIFSLNLIWDSLIQQGRAYSAVYPASIYDIGTKDSFYAAAEFL